MRSVKLTVLIEDSTDLDMEVRVVAPEQQEEANAATTPVVLLKPRAVPPPRCSIDDEYTLGGYAGI
jgi:hypothetical protein